MSASKELTLEDRVKALEEQNAILQGKNKELSDQLSAVVTGSGPLEERLTVLESQNAKLEIKNRELSDQLSAVVTGSDPKEPVKPTIPEKAEFSYQKKKYKVVAPSVTIPGIGYRTAEELLVDVKAQEALVKMNSGVIKECV